LIGTDFGYLLHTQHLMLEKEFSPMADETDIPSVSDTTDRTQFGSVKENVERSTPDRGVVDPMETVAPDPESRPST
jgi:hypothetical protein